MKSWPLFLKTIILRRPRVANFADIIKVATMFIKTVLEDSKKMKRIKIYVIKIAIYPTGIVLFNVNKSNTKTVFEICSKRIIKTPERRQWHRSGVYIVYFEQI